MLDTPTFTSDQVRAFQELLINARRLRGLTQTDAANQIGVSQTLISKIERGPHPGMRVDELFRVLAFYNIEPNQIADVLGYTVGQTPYTPEEDARLQSVVSALMSVPDEVAETIYTSLEWMLRGSTSR